MVSVSTASAVQPSARALAMRAAISADCAPRLRSLSRGRGRRADGRGPRTLRARRSRPAGRPSNAMKCAEALLAGRAHEFVPHRVAELAFALPRLPRHSLPALSSTVVNAGGSRALANERRIARPTHARRKTRLGSQRRTVSISGPGLSQTKNRCTPAPCKLLDQARDALGTQSGLGPAQMDAIPVAGRMRPWRSGSNVTSAIAERRAVMPRHGRSRPAGTRGRAKPSAASWSAPVR